MIDLLADGQKFIVLRRESRLEMAMLDGTLTATILPEGLEVGDTLDIAVTYQERDPLLTGHDARVAVVPSAPTGHFMIREIWPQSRTLKWRETKGLPEPRISPTPWGMELVIDMVDAVRPKAPRAAPARYAMQGRFEISQAQDWGEVSRLMSPLYEKAELLKPGSALKTEAARIKAASGDPKTRAAAALRLVQDKVRYLFLGMDKGGYTPANADVTWARRFGDCKGKTVLLLALLKEVGIEADPALVNTNHGDGLDGRIPIATAFDHVLVRAVIDGVVYWLDGTDSTAGRLDDPTVPNFGWALPVRPAGAALEKLVVPPLDKPAALTKLQLDASGGLDIPAPAHAELVTRGDAAIRNSRRLAGMTPPDREQYLRDYWRQEYDWIDIDTVGAFYDEATGEETMSMDGSAKMEWRGGSAHFGRRYETDGGVLGWKADFARDPGPDQDAPFEVDHPDYTKTVETIILPNRGKGFTVEGEDVDELVAGRAFKRTSKIDKGVFTMEAGTRTMAAEFPAADAEAAGKELRRLSDVVVHIRAPARYIVTDQELARLMASTPVTASDFIDRGNRLYDRDRYDSAIADFNEALKLEPDSSSAFADRGNAYLYSGRKDEATADFERSLQRDPRNAVATRGQGIISEEKGEYPRAIELFTHAIDLDPRDAFSLEHRANDYLGVKELDKALGDYQQVLSLEPTRVDIHEKRCMILFSRGDGAAMLAEANAMMSLREDEESHTLRGTAFLMLSKRAEAREDFERSIAIKPTADAYLGRAESRGTDDIDQSIADADLALKIMPDWTPAFFDRARFYRAAGKLDLAIADFSRVLQVLPDDPASLIGRSEAYGASGRFDLALRDADNLVAKKPDDPARLNDRCWLRALFGRDLDLALADCDASIKIKDAPSTRDSRGFVYLRLQRFDDAIAEYDAALASHPKLAPSLFGRGIAKLRKGATDDGQTDLAAARAVDPKIEVTFAGYGVKP